MQLANHTSWLDVFLLMSIAPSLFVAKTEIARWPVLGTLVSRVGTLFIERGKRHAVHRLNRRIAEALGDGLRVTVFPEGTTSDGRQLLPFHGNLVEAALHTRAPVIPVGLRYLDREHRPTDAAVFIGRMAFVTSLARILSAPAIVAEVRPLAPAEGQTRQGIAEAARRAIAECLSLPLDGRVPTISRQARGAGDRR
ncbi:MAG TPA: lysophospholipid acyltransferase family protein [Burkholderiaceae bacterium]|jgi:1-acyl-sn-glycerol-3-phosphate acyltransferase|nr:lysophospholipid acyltransferase family protein [Burkholderiaceae bacterium]